MKGFRLIDRFGFNILRDNVSGITKGQFAEDFQIWEYHLQSGDWINNEHESNLPAYNPPADLVQILANQIDIKKE